ACQPRYADREYRRLSSRSANGHPLATGAAAETSPGIRAKSSAADSSPNHGSREDVASSTSLSAMVLPSSSRIRTEKAPEPMALHFTETSDSRATALRQRRRSLDGRQETGSS